MKQYLRRVARWLAVVVAAIALVQSIVLPASAMIEILPGQDFQGPICPQIQISASPDCSPYEYGVYSLETDGPTPPLTDRNFVPCLPGAIDSYFSPPDGAQSIRIVNVGYIPIEFTPVCD